MMELFSSLKVEMRSLRADSVCDEDMLSGNVSGHDKQNALEDRYLIDVI